MKQARMWKIIHIEDPTPMAPIQVKVNLANKEKNDPKLEDYLDYFVYLSQQFYAANIF